MRRENWYQDVVMGRRAFLILVWGLFFLGGFFGLTRYSFQDAQTMKAKKFWPAGLEWKRAKDLPTMVVFLHPQCGCSKATVAEIETMMPTLAGKVQVILSFYAPSAKSTEWAQSKLWSSVQGWAGVEARLDQDGKQAEKFRATVSGETFFYGADGRLLFHGGLTPSRGHRGDTPGRQLILAHVEGKSSAPVDSRVFGCALREGKWAVIAGEE